MARHPDTTYADRVEQARARMYAAFAPLDDDETVLVGWLFERLAPHEADRFSAMVERQATAKPGLDLAQPEGPRP